MEVYLGAALLIAWALVVFWSLAMIAGAGLASGISLAVEQERVIFGIHTIGLGFMLALVATLVLLAFAIATRR